MISGGRCWRRRTREGGGDGEGGGEASSSCKSFRGAIGKAERSVFWSEMVKRRVEEVPKNFREFRRSWFGEEEGKEG